MTSLSNLKNNVKVYDASGDAVESTTVNTKNGLNVFTVNSGLPTGGTDYYVTGGGFAASGSSSVGDLSKTSYSERSSNAQRSFISFIGGGGNNYDVTVKTFAPTDIDVTTNIVTIPAHGYDNSGGVLPVVFTTTGTAPAPLVNGTTYFIRSGSLTANSFAMSTSSGSGISIDFTTQGTGVHTLTTAGTGIRTVRVTYYDVSGNGPFTDVVSLRGGNGANTTATDICFIEKLEAVTTGSSGACASNGDLRLMSSTGGGGSVVMSISPSDTQTFSAHHYVPLGKTAYIRQIDLSGDTASTPGCTLILALRTTPNTNPSFIADTFVLPPAAGGVSKTYASPIQVVGPKRIVVAISALGISSSRYFATIQYYEV